MEEMTALTSSGHAKPAEASERARGERRRTAETIAREAGAVCDRRARLSPYDLTDIHSGFESTRLRLFVLTGTYWRGT